MRLIRLDGGHHLRDLWGALYPSFLHEGHLHFQVHDVSQQTFQRGPTEKENCIFLFFKYIKI